jgi:hypothetical protein
VVSQENEATSQLADSVQFESAKITEGGDRLLVAGFASSVFPFFSRGRVV